jgi:dipeptidyl aminopeptidase/acylaminoacyl peptidase
VIKLRNIKIDDFTDYSYISNLETSANKENFAFVLSKANLKDNCYEKNIYLGNLEQKNIIKLTNSGKDMNLKWLNKNELIFISQRNKDEKEEKSTHLYKININGGEAEKFITIDQNISSYKILQENKIIFTSINDNYKDNLSKDQLEEEKDYEVFEEIPFWSNGNGYVSKKRNTLNLYDIETKKIKNISGKEKNISHYDIKNEKIVFISNEYEHKMPLNEEIYIYDLKTEESKKLKLNEKLSIAYAYFIDENTLIFSGSNMKKYGINENMKFYSYDLRNDQLKCITPELDQSMWNSVGTDCRLGSTNGPRVKDKKLYFVSTVGYYSNIFSVDLNGDVKQITDIKGTVDGFDILENDFIYYGLKSDLSLQSIYTYNQNIKLTNFNDWVLKELKLSHPEKVELNKENIKIDGWILKPVDFDENKKYPSILDIHGGPKTVYSDIFYNEMQYWVNQGYVVFFCNPRGSDGKGNEFSDIRGKFGTIDYEDIMDFTDTIIKKYDFIDQNRIGVTGGSYGGFMTNWIIGNTNRFKAAASQRSISNWISKSMTTDIGYYFVQDQQDANPWSDIMKLWNQSPLKYADKAKTPTLFIQSDEDYRCYMAEAIQMFTALKVNETDSKLVLFHGENHELSRSGKPKHRIRRLKEITDWMNKYLI